MGSSDWVHFVPYQADIDQALQTLRQQVFASGAYLVFDYGDWRMLDETEVRRQLPTDDPELADILLAEWRQVKALSEPDTIEGLLSWNQEAGTHSVLDMMNGVADQPTFGAVAPLTDAQLTAAFGSARPTHQAVADGLDALRRADLRERWQGVYIVVYENGQPTELCFAGSSGD